MNEYKTWLLEFSTDDLKQDFIKWLEKNQPSVRCDYHSFVNSQKSYKVRVWTHHEIDKNWMLSFKLTWSQFVLVYPVEHYEC